jgi:hypothetical protein
MISWRIPTTYEGLSSSSFISRTESWSRSSTLSNRQTTTFSGQTATGSGSSSSESTFYSYEYSGYGFQSTEYSSSYSSSSTATSSLIATQEIISYDEDDNEVTETETYTEATSGSDSYSTSETFSSTYQLTSYAQTSTTTTAAYAAYSLSSSTAERVADEYFAIGIVTTWTTYTFSNSFLQTTGIDTSSGMADAYWFLTFTTYSAIASVTIEKANTTTQASTSEGVNYDDDGNEFTEAVNYAATVSNPNSETVTYHTWATVVQAAEDEVIYHIANPGSDWDGYAEARPLAASATRITLYPTAAVTEGILSASDVTTTSSWSSPGLSSSLSLKTLSLSSFSLARPANTTVISPSTTTVRFDRFTTQSTSQSYQIFASSTSTTFNTWGIGKSTTDVPRFGFLPETVFQQWQNVAYDAVVATKTTSSRTTYTIGAYVTSETSTTEETLTNNVTIFEGAGADVTSSSAQEEKREYSYATLPGGNTTLSTVQIGVGGIGFPETQQFRWGTAGVAVGNSTGGWFTAAQTFTMGFAYTAADGSRRRVSTLAATSNSTWTLSSNFLSYTTLSGTDTTTTTALVGVSGSTFIQEDGTSRPASAYLHFGGGPFAAGWTVVDHVGVGAYSDIIGNQTTFFTGEDTVYTAGESAAISRFVLIPNVNPPAPVNQKNGIFWVQKKNSYYSLYLDQALVVDTGRMVDAEVGL